MLKKLINGATLASIEKMLHSLQELALVHRAEPPHGAAPPAGAKQRYYLPVGSLKDVIGIYPAGLGRSYTELVRLQPAFAQRVVQLVGELHRSGAAISPAATPMEAALSLQHWTATPESLRQILATAPERTAALLARFGNWAMGAVPQAQRRASVLHEAADVGPVDWLLARGLLVPLDAAHVELPHSVGVSLRGGFVIEKFALTPPVPRLGSTSAALRRNAALGAIAETLRLVGELLHSVREQPLVTLRSGGVGVRELQAPGGRTADRDARRRRAGRVVRPGRPHPPGRGQFRLGPAAAAGVADASAAGTVALAGQCLARQRAGTVPRGTARQRPGRGPGRCTAARPGAPSTRSPPKPSARTPRWSGNGSWKSWPN